MDERFETFTESDDEWFSDIELRALDLEKEITEWRESRARELAESARLRERERELAEAAYLRDRERELDEPDFEPDEAPGHTQAFHHEGDTARRPREFLRATGKADPGYDAERTAAGRTQAHSATGHPWPVREDIHGSSGDRTQVLIDRGRRTARQSRVGRSRRSRNLVVASVAGLVVIIVCAIVVFRQGPSWPASVATVKGEITAACQNPNVVSEPSQVNFACGKDTSQILWVFALMTSNDNPRYADARTGRKGLEPITPAQGGEIAWSLNLHHPYNPLSPVDSLAVAARAVNNIIGGATLTGTNGSPAVQPGLESNPSDCARYTGSPAIISHPGFPSLCANPVSSPEGRAALVADVYRQWMVGATSVAAQNVAVLFQNANNPGDPQVQAILKTLGAAA